MNHVVDRAYHCCELKASPTTHVCVVVKDGFTWIETDQQAVEHQRVQEAKYDGRIVYDETPSTNKVLVKYEKISFHGCECHQVQSHDIHAVVKGNPERTKLIVLRLNMTVIGVEQGDR